MKKQNVVFIIFILLVTGCATKNFKENRLRHRVTEYYTHLSKGEFDLSRDLLMKYSRDKWNQEEWTELLKRYFSNNKPIERRIKSILIKKVDKHILGEVTIFAKTESLKQNKIESFEQEEDWVFENGDWFKYVD